MTTKTQSAKRNAAAKKSTRTAKPITRWNNAEKRALFLIVSHAIQNEKVTRAAGVTVAHLQTLLAKVPQYAKI